MTRWLVFSAASLVLAATACEKDSSSLTAQEAPASARSAPAEGKAAPKKVQVKPDADVELRVLGMT